MQIFRQQHAASEALWLVYLALDSRSSAPPVIRDESRRIIAGTSA
eukprot:COSAG03_NODE_18141_length_361_cov_0.778626_1_plen_44_part_10